MVVDKVVVVVVVSFVPWRVSVTVVVLVVESASVGSDKGLKQIGQSPSEAMMMRGKLVWLRVSMCYQC